MDKHLIGEFQHGLEIPKLGILHYEAYRLTLWSDECPPSFLTRNTGRLAHHPSSVLSPADDDDDNSVGS